MARPTFTNCISIDVEDWFHLLDTRRAPSRQTWRCLESRVTENTRRLLDLFDRYSVQATFFVLGWIAEQHPSLVREIAAAGHEIASHGYAHELVYQQTRDEFRHDLAQAERHLLHACGQRPLGYRAPGFSIRPDSAWAWEVLAERGYAYDASLFPARRRHGGWPGNAALPHRLMNGLWEIPVSTLARPWGRQAFLGGGYLRLWPERWILRWAERLTTQGQPLVLYLHPRDIDPHQPRLQLSARRRFTTYVGLETAWRKLESLLKQFVWGPLIQACPQLARRAA